MNNLKTGNGKTPSKFFSDLESTFKNAPDWKPVRVRRHDAVAASYVKTAELQLSIVEGTW